MVRSSPHPQRSHLLRRDPIRVRRIGHRGRVVMLVDNAVVGDSRVQKQARSAAEQGWDVILLGRRRKRDRADIPDSWRLGPARVRLLRFDDDMARPRHELRRGWLGSPFAYASVAFARYRQTEVVAKVSDLQYQIADTRRRRTPDALFARQWHRIRLRFALRAQLPWVTWRVGRTSLRADRRRTMSGPVDRLATWWWTATRRGGAWRRLEPQLLEFEAVYGPVVDQLQPDIIHANDFRMLGVGARAVTRAAARGREVKLVWDAHEFLPGLERPNTHPRWREGQLLHERRFASYADAVITVADPMADALQREHGLRDRPVVVLNAPRADDSSVDGGVVDVRQRCGLSADVPLLVYSGFAAPRRGLDTMVDALPDLPGVQVALVVSFPVNGYVKGLRQRARSLGVGDRLHLLPYVPVEQIVPYLSTATAGVFPGHRNLNHDLTLPTKLFEYAHAQLPMLVSDVTGTAEMIQRHQIGEVFVAEDTADYVRAARTLLTEPDRYRSMYARQDLLTEWSWERQAAVLDGVYEQVLHGQDRR